MGRNLWIHNNSNDELEVVKRNEIELEDEKDIDDGDYDEEDEEITEDDKHEESKIALLLEDICEPVADSSITENALMKLIFLAMNERNRKLIRIAGAIPILINHLNAADSKIGLTSIQSLALGCLAVLCRNIRNREEVRRHQGLFVIIKFIQNLKDDADCIEALKATKELSKNEQNKATFRHEKLIEVLISKIELKKVNQQIQELALEILTIINMNDSKSQVITRDAGGIPAIIKHIQANNIELKRRGIRAIGAIAQNNKKIQQIVRKTAVLETLVNILSRNHDDGCKKSAAIAISALAENNYTNQIAIRDYGVVELLMKILRSDEVKNDVKEHAAAAVRSLAKGNAKIQGDFRDGITTLVNLMANSPTVDLKIHSIGAIMELSRDNPQNCDIICESGAVHTLVDALKSDNTIVQYLSEGAIWTLARKSNKRRALFRDANAIEPLRMLKLSDNPKVKRGAEFALDALC